MKNGTAQNTWIENIKTELNFFQCSYGLNHVIPLIVWPFFITLCHGKDLLLPAECFQTSMLLYFSPLLPFLSSLPVHIIRSQMVYQVHACVQNLNII